MSEPMPDPALGSQAIPTTPCDVCGITFGPGDVWNYHARLGVYVHSKCAAEFPVRGEDITTHTVLWGQIPEPPPMTGPEVTAAIERAGEAVKETVCTAWPAYVSDRMAVRIATDALSRALDVEEVADTLARVRFEQMRESFQMVGTEWPDAPEFMREKFLVLARPFATALRAALIGADS